MVATAAGFGLTQAHDVAQANVEAKALQAVTAAFQGLLDPQDLDKSFPAYSKVVHKVISQFRGESADLAKAYYGALRSLEGAPGSAPDVKVAPLPEAQAETSLLVTGPVQVKSALAGGSTLDQALLQALQMTLGSSSRHVQNGAREALTASVKADPHSGGWTRRSGGSPCSFCAMLISRGPVYKGSTANFRTHDHCHCTAVPFFGSATGWTAQAAEFSGLWNAATVGRSGADARAAFRKAYEAKHPRLISPAQTKIAAQVEHVQRTAAQIVKDAANEAAAKAAEAAAAEKAAFAKFHTMPNVDDVFALAESGDVMAIKYLHATGYIGDGVRDRLIAEAEPAAQAAKAAAKAAEEAASAAARAAEEAAKAAAEAEAKAAAEAEAKLAKWKDKPAPKAPKPPTPPAAQAERLFDGWLAKVNARYDALGTGKPLSKSLNYSQVKAVIESQDRHAVEQLLAGKYLDRELADEALEIFGKVADAKALAEEDYRKALKRYKTATTKHSKQLAEWREANGISISLKGMEGAEDFANAHSAVAWANDHFPKPGHGSVTALRSYTGSDYGPWNAALRRNADGLKAPQGWEAKTAAADKGMTPSPADFMVRRGTSWDEFAFPSGERTRSLPPPDPRSLIGTVQAQHGYMSTSVGPSAAFSRDVRMVIRVPEGHGAAWVRTISHYQSENEMLLSRSTQLFIHDVYKDGAYGGWVVEAEVLPPGIDPSSLAGHPALPRANKA